MELRHVYWIGGGSCAGKSTIARRLAAEYGLQLYATDDVMADHARRSTPADSPFLHKFTAMDMDQRWLNRSPAEMLETFHWFRGEGFNRIIDDVLRLPEEPAVIIEGFRLLPHLVEPLLAARNHAVWLLPTLEFRQAHGGAQWTFLDKTSDPPRARRNLLERDALFTQHLREEAQRLELNTIAVDSTMTVDEVTREVVKTFGL